MKLTAKELRIGNWIKSEPLNIPRLNVQSNGCMQITGYGISVLESDTNEKLPWQPILLTEEILLKCNFRKSNNKLMFLYVPILKMEIHAELFRGKWLIELINDIKPIVTEVYYLHQLQNLYFALTGKELEIKL